MNTKLLSIAIGDPVAMEQLAGLQQAAQRYETVRRMSPQAFADAWKLNISTGKPFDQIIDELAPFFQVKRMRGEGGA